jgi:hypothetical protein
MQIYRQPLQPPQGYGAHLRKDVHMLAHRPDAASIFVTVLLSTGVAALSIGVGFSLVVAAAVGVVTATVGWWATA